jgi:hypothetical protein
VECAGVTGNTDKERLISPDVTSDVTALSAATLIMLYDNELRATPALFPLYFWTMKNDSSVAFWLFFPDKIFLRLI